MEYGFSVMTRMILEDESGEPVQKYCEINLNTTANIKESQYFDEDGLPNKDGSVAITYTLVSALATNIHAAHQRGQRDSAEHLRFIISELERQFMSEAEIMTRELKPSGWSSPVKLDVEPIVVVPTEPFTSVKSVFDNELKTNVITIDAIDYLPLKCNEFKKGDFVWNPFWFDTPVIIAKSCTLSLNEYNRSLDCYKLERKCYV